MLLLDGMWLDAIVTASDLQQIVDQLTPATVPLGERGHLYFDAPAEVSLVEGRGLRVRCHATVKYPVLGIDVALTIRSMTLMVLPSIESRDGERVIVLSPEVETIDLALLPDIGDVELRAFLNRELLAKRVELPWNYQTTLSHRVPLPEWFRESSTFDICADGATVKVTNESLGLAIGFTAAVTPFDPNATVTSRPSSRPVANGSQQVVPQVVDNVDFGEPQRSHGMANGVAHVEMVPYRRPRKLGVGFAVAAGFGLGCLLGLWRTGRSA
ncbi:MAG: hypothetical protein ABW133_15165 [Polyangiaceae bacterium]